MRKFRDLMEAKDTIVFAFGRFNPPTTGHEKMIQKTVSVAGSNPYRIFPSHTQNPKRDPLPQALKTAYMRKMFKKYARNIVVSKSRNAIEIAVELYDQGYKNLIMVAGSDRVKVFDTMLNNYNGVEGKAHGYYKFDSIKIVNAGERDPDSEGVEGMSASKMRVAASNGDMDSFLQGVPSGFADGKKLYRDVRKYMGIREEKDMGDMTDFEAVRDAYLVGKIWNVGETVEANGLMGEVVRKGTNYLSFMTEDGKVNKAWLHEIELDEVKAPDIKKGDVIILSKSKRPYSVAGIIDPKKTLPAESDKMVVNKITKSKDGRKAHLTYHDPKKRGGFAIYLDKMPDFMSVKKEEVELDEDASVYKKTARKNKSGKSTFAFGRRKKLDGQPKEKGGYFVWKLSQNYDGKVKGGIRNSWAQVAKDLSYSDAVKLMNKKLGRKEFKEEVELDERNYAKEYQNYHSQPEQIANRSSRNKARRVMGDKTKIGMDVGHKDNNPLNNDPKNLRNEDPAKNRREPRLREKPEADVAYMGGSDALVVNNKIVAKGAKSKMVSIAKKSHGGLKRGKVFVIFTGKKVGDMLEEVKLDEFSSQVPWLDRAISTAARITHPKGWNKVVAAYVDGMKDKENQKHPSSWAADVSQRYRVAGLTPRSLIKYINTLVAKGQLPKELKAEYVSEQISFKDLVNQIQERELSSNELKRREEIAKDLSDDDFKKRYGDRWKEVKMGVATKMAKKESIKT